MKIDLSKKSPSEAFKAVAAWYEEQTGQGAGRGGDRIWRVLEFLERHSLRLDQVQLQDHSDEMWNQRPIRTEKEKIAECIGATSNVGKPRFRWWVVPR